MRTGLREALVVVLVAVFAAACATARAAAPRELPALEVPPPPPRLIIPLPAPQPPPLEPVGDLPGSTTPPPSRPRPQRPAEAPSRPETKTEEKTETPPVAPPVPQLRMPDGGNSTQVLAQIRDSINRTRGALENIDYRTLSQQRQKAYDDAKLFSNQAEEALKSSNLVVARELADKAERLARELQNR